MSQEVHSYTVQSQAEYAQRLRIEKAHDPEARAAKPLAESPPETSYLRQLQATNEKLVKRHWGNGHGAGQCWA